MSDLLKVGQRIELICTSDGVHSVVVIATPEIISQLVEGDAVECPTCRTDTAGLPSSSNVSVLYENYCN